MVESRENVVVGVGKILLLPELPPPLVLAYFHPLMPFCSPVYTSYFHRSNCLLHGLLHDILSPSSSFLGHDSTTSSTRTTHTPDAARGHF